MPFTNYSIPLLLAHLFGAGPYYVSAHTADPTAAGNVGEVSGDGYARMEAALTLTGNVVDNDADLVSAEATGDGWGTITHTAVWDAPTGGNCLMRGPLTTPKEIEAGDALRIKAGELDLTAT